MKVCKKCKKEKSIGDFPRNKNYKDGYNVLCKVCKKAIDKTYHEKKKLDPNWVKERTEKTTKYNRLKYAGFTSELFDQRLAEQNGRCAICGTDDPGATNWHADHCHITNSPRGILCKKCNTGIGMLNDDKEIVLLAYEYLKHYTN